ncbi:hypothetical protein [Labilibacter marinus]|uniref:hypothetical protein n=1 Tax=Labilibacter marinus TaxID=1477105 RepID=UPI0008296AAE|nr:hypothetical protein [Labilibacter marinus]
MKSIAGVLTFFLIVAMLFSCKHNGYKDKIKRVNKKDVNVLFLHHSTGKYIYRGGLIGKESAVKKWFESYNEGADSKINFVEEIFPKRAKYKFQTAYGWNNYPYDYFNIWVKNGDKKEFVKEPTLKLLAPLWDVIVLKHCFPVCEIGEDLEVNINSEYKCIGNYKLQYEAIKKEMHKYPNTKFIVWTGAALTKENSNENQSMRAKEFFYWVKNEWASDLDNIYVWDFFDLETEGGIYLLDKYAKAPNDSHPNKEFSAKVVPLFCNRVVDVVFNKGKNTNILGENK